jgi:hypothetical protein
VDIVAVVVDNVVGYCIPVAMALRNSVVGLVACCNFERDDEAMVAVEYCMVVLTACCNSVQL